MILFCLALFAFTLAAAFLLRARRDLLALDVRCEAAAADVAREAERLHALFPALVGLTRAFAPTERDAIEAVAKAHAAAQRAHSPQARLLADTRLADSVHYLVARARQVDQIGGLKDFTELRLAIDEAERRLAAARRRLSAATEAYNQALGRFPGTLFAMRLRLAPRAFYDIGSDLGAELLPEEGAA